MEFKAIKISGTPIDSKIVLEQVSLKQIDEAYRKHANPTAGRSANKEKAINRLWKFLNPAGTVTGRTKVASKSTPAKAAPVKASAKVASKSTPTARKPGPVADVHMIASQLFIKHGKELARKDVIAACVAKGINPSTASTQYQKWKKENDL